MAEPLVNKKFGTVLTKIQEMRDYSQTIGGRIERKYNKDTKCHEIYLFDKNGKAVQNMIISQDVISYTETDGTVYESYGKNATNGEFTTIISADGCTYAKDDETHNGVVDENEVRVNFRF